MTLPLVKSQTARSSLPSPLKSPTATATGVPPDATVVPGANVPSVWPIRMETLAENALATAKSGMPSPLKSPSARLSGKVPVA